MKNKAFIYMRFSTEEQMKQFYENEKRMSKDKELVVLYIRTANDDKYKLEQQEYKLRKYCKLKNYEVQALYVDFNCSGTNMNRPQLQSLQKDIKQGKVKKIVTCNLSRISRDYFTTLTFLKTLKDNKCGFESLDYLDMNIYNIPTINLYLAEKDEN